MGYNNGNCYEVQSYFGKELDELCSGAEQRRIELMQELEG